MVWFILDFDFNLKKSAGAIGVSLGIIQIDFMYAFLVLNKSLLAKIMDSFQSIVEKSKLSAEFPNEFDNSKIMIIFEYFRID